jgi:hypothetical protein
MSTTDIESLQFNERGGGEWKTQWIDPRSPQPSPPWWHSVHPFAWHRAIRSAAIAHGAPADSAEAIADEAVRQVQEHIWPFPVSPSGRSDPVPPPTTAADPPPAGAAAAGVFNAT